MLSENVFSHVNLSGAKPEEQGSFLVAWASLCGDPEWVLCALECWLNMSGKLEWLMCVVYLFF